MKKNLIKFPLLIRSLLLFAFVIIMSSWGFLVHRTLHQIAIYSLPEPLNKYYYYNMKELVKTSVDPDLRRKDDLTEETKHFIDLDAPIFKQKSIPNNWNGAVKKFTEKKLRKYGTLPWEIIKTKDKLTEAFKAKDNKKILLYSSDLGHYLADACVPLHVTANFDGQLTNQVGLHLLWESDCPQLFFDQYNLKQSDKAKYIKNVNNEIWAVLRESQKMVNSVLENDIEATKGINIIDKYKIQLKNGIEEKKFSGKYIKQYQAEAGEQINSRMLRAAELISDIWYTAWIDANSPDLASLYISNEKSNKQILKEYESWKTNQLLKNKLLRAKNGNN